MIYEDNMHHWTEMLWDWEVVHALARREPAIIPSDDISPPCRVCPACCHAPRCCVKPPSMPVTKERNVEKRHLPQTTPAVSPLLRTLLLAPESEPKSRMVGVGTVQIGYSNAFRHPSFRPARLPPSRTRCRTVISSPSIVQNVNRCLLPDCLSVVVDGPCRPLTLDADVPLCSALR